MTRDPSRYRPGVGLILTEGRGRVWLGQRAGGYEGEQLPQGGIEPGETIEDAVWRELEEEVGTRNAELLGSTKEWTFYDFPPESSHRDLWDGQRHRWFVLRFLGDQSELDPAGVAEPEFEGWRWATPDEAIAAVVTFKQPVYRFAFTELARFLQ